MLRYGGWLGVRKGEVVFKVDGGWKGWLVQDECDDRCWNAMTLSIECCLGRSARCVQVVEQRTSIRSFGVQSTLNDHASIYCIASFIQ
jgi:hypothetical protein